MRRDGTVKDIGFNSGVSCPVRVREILSLVLSVLVVIDRQDAVVVHGLEHLAVQRHKGTQPYGLRGQRPV